MFGPTLADRQPVDPRTHSSLASHVHAAATNGGGDVLVGIAVVFGCSLALFALVWFTRGADGPDSGPGSGGGGGGPSGPSSPPSGPSWWPDFEREFARYAASPAARRRSPDHVRGAHGKRAPAPPEN
jgi:hypothetical protein